MRAIKHVTTYTDGRGLHLIALCEDNSIWELQKKDQVRWSEQWIPINPQIPDAPKREFSVS